MATLTQYAKQEITSGRFPMTRIVAGECGTFWVEDGDYRTLDGACFMSREAAEKARSKAYDKAMKFAA